MTEAEWLTTPDPTPMLAFLRGRASDRRLRLVCVECCRLLRRNRPPNGGIADIECVARLADGADNLEEVRTHWHRRGRGRRCSFPEAPFEWCSTFARIAGDRDRGKAYADGYPTRTEVASLLREVFGNPFRLVPSGITSPIRREAGAGVRLPVGELCPTDWWRPNTADPIRFRRGEGERVTRLPKGWTGT
jgi:hypothetical protein